MAEKQDRIKAGGRSSLEVALRTNLPFPIVMASAEPVTAPGGFVGNLTGNATTATTATTATNATGLTGLTASVAELNIMDGVTATANEINGAADGTVASVLLTVAGESPAGTNSVLVEFLDGNAVAYTHAVGFWCFWSDNADGTVLGTAFTGFTTAPSGGIELGGFTANIFQYVTATDGTITVGVTGGTTSTQYLAIIMPNGRVFCSGAVTFA